MCASFCRCSSPFLRPTLRSAALCPGEAWWSRTTAREFVSMSNDYDYEIMTSLRDYDLRDYFYTP